MGRSLTATTVGVGGRRRRGSGVRRRREVEVGRSLTATTVGRRRRDGEMAKWRGGGRKSGRGENGSEKMGRKNGGDCTVLKLLFLFLLPFTSVDIAPDVIACHVCAITSVDISPDVIAATR